MSFTLASFAITAALCYVIYHVTMWHWRRRRLYSMSAKIGGPLVLPFIGNAHLFMGNTEYLLNRLNNMSEFYPSLFRFWLGPVLIFCTSDPELMKTICLDPKTLNKGALFTDFMRPWLGTGILTARLPKWKVQRKLIQPTFNVKILDSFVEIFSAQSKILTEKMEQYLNGPEFEVFDLISRCTLDMICETAMGVRMGTQTERNCYFVEAIQKILSGVCKRMANLWLRPDFIFYHIQLGKDQKKDIKYLHEFTSNVIQTKKKQLIERQSRPVTADDENFNTSGDSTLQRKGFLDHLIQLPNTSGSLSDEELREEVDTMVAAGNDSNATTSLYVILMLASHPEVQEKVYQELFDIYGEYDIAERPVTPQDLPRMKYLERMIKETLRLFPPAPYIIREFIDDMKIGKQNFPKGGSILLGILPLHRDEKYWPDPLKFDPDRFLPEEIAKRHPYAFMAFSGGPRNCIGLNYAMMSIKTMIATILRKFVLKKDNVVSIKDIRLKLDILMKPVDPIKIRIEKRNVN